MVRLNFTQLQYKNPDVQILCVRNLTPSPFLTFFLGKLITHYLNVDKDAINVLILDDGEKVHVDVEGMTQMEIVRHVQKVFGKPR